MANYNRVILAGNMTRDPELSYTPSNTPVCKFGIAVNRTWTDRQTNVKHEETMFIDCTAWSKSAEVINQYCSKGKPILLEGRLVLDTWTNQEGQKRSRHTVTVDNFQFLGSPGGARSTAPASAPSTDVPDQPPGPDDAPF